MDYKSTLNMPKSGFPMRAGLPKREPEMLKHWEEMDLYNEHAQKERGQAPLRPARRPSVLQRRHCTWVTRSTSPSRTSSPAPTPCAATTRPISPAGTTTACPSRAPSSSRTSSTTRPCPSPSSAPPATSSPSTISTCRWRASSASACVGDWEHPYKTMDPGFEAEEVKVFGEMYKKGYIYKGLKPVYWCYHDETALAEAEIEYQDDPCTTVYVKFPMNDDLGKLRHLDKSQAQLRHLDDHDLDAARQPRHRAAPRRELRHREERRQRRDVYRRRGALPRRS